MRMRYLFRTLPLAVTSPFNPIFLHHITYGESSGVRPDFQSKIQKPLQDFRVKFCLFYRFCARGVWGMFYGVFSGFDGFFGVVLGPETQNRLVNIRNFDQEKKKGNTVLPG